MRRCEEPCIGAVAAALEEAFGTSFQLWSPGSGWELAYPEHEVGRLDGEERDAITASLQGSRSAIVLQRNGNRQLLAIPLCPDGTVRWIATAELSAADADVLLRWASLFLRQYKLQTELTRLTAENEAHVLETTQCFEEVVFLRRIADHLDVADVSLDVIHLARIVLPLLAELISAESLAFVPSQPGGQAVDLRRAVTVGNSPQAEAVARLDVIGSVVERYRARADEHPLVRNTPDSSVDLGAIPGVRELVLVSVARGEQVVGWLVAINRTCRYAPQGQHEWCELNGMEFGTVEAGLLASTASILATHAKNVELFRQKEQLFVGAVRSLVSAIEARDSYTCGHSERVAIFARRLAEEMGLNDEACEHIYLSGLFHDIGKIGIPDSTLLKPGKLTDDEYREVKRHPERSWSILQGLGPLGNVLPAIVHHHESFDGTGYPDGLAGEQIPLASRILAVADTYDALTSNRPYRPGMSQERAEEILRQGSGSQWDPAVVAALFSSMPDIIALRLSYRQSPAPCRAAESADAETSPGVALTSA